MIYKDYKPVRYFERNKNGTDYAVGDIHGEFRSLDKLLDKVKFNKKKDRLFSTGDLVDRGESSNLVLDYLKEDWFFAVKGNHDCVISQLDKASASVKIKYKTRFGGEWFFEQQVKQQKNIITAFKQLPLGMHIETENGNVGIVHADLPTATWSVFDKQANAMNLKIIEQVLWSMERPKIKDQIIPDLKAVICGHMSARKVRILGNFYLIDTGSGSKGGKLTMLNLTNMEEV